MEGQGVRARSILVTASLVFPSTYYPNRDRFLLANHQTSRFQSQNLILMQGKGASPQGQGEGVKGKGV
ncbi:hypothetical protein NIES593_22440 [Hydrococcus rivularis NIES-593]|uniref:Uncharacterized protein n=2 Tax=Hydrococcus TaxID=1616833 RepID=A0A1U7H7C3_9CYAN|nr:hypothetical protein NIES593_22440 [Hydrococcus rivularis NIES-593]